MSPFCVTTGEVGGCHRESKNFDTHKKIEHSSKATRQKQRQGNNPIVFAISAIGVLTYKGRGVGVQVWTAPCQNRNLENPISSVLSIENRPWALREVRRLFYEGARIVLVAKQNGIITIQWRALSKTLKHHREVGTFEDPSHHMYLSETDDGRPRKQPQHRLS